MVRESIGRDISSILELLKSQINNLEENIIIEKLQCNENMNLVYEDNNKIVGICSTSVSNDKVKKGGITIYVSELYRRCGIGEQLFSKAIDYLEQKNINNINIEIRTEKICSGNFFINRGFKKWFGYDNIIYCGDIVESDLDLVNYEELYYERYKNVYEDCFFEMRNALGFKPARDCYSEDELIKNKDNIFLLVNGEDLIGAVSLINNEIDDLIVNEIYQGKGYGKKILNFAISGYQRRGVKKILLGVAHWNDKAINLYTSSGFKTEVSVEVYSKISIE